LFDPLHQEFTPGQRISNIFPDRFSFNLVDKKEKITTRAQELDNLVLLNSSPSFTIVVTDASIKDNIATSIAYVHQANSPLIKTIHHAVFVTSSEAELFAMRCGINQACCKDNISKIVVITDSIHSAKRIFDSSVHPLQSHSAAILSKLRLSSTKVRIIPSSFESVLVASNGGFTKTSTKIPSRLNQLPHSLAKFRGIIAKNPIATILLWDALDMNNFYFLLFSDFIGIFVFFFFFFSFG